MDVVEVGVVTRRAIAAGVLLVAVHPLACKPVRHDDGPPVVEEAVYVPPPQVVFHALAELGADSFADARFGVDDEAALREAFALDRHEVRDVRWGKPGAEVPVIEVRDARRTAVTAMILDPGDGTLRSVLVRDLDASPPPQQAPEGFLPYLAAFPGRIHVLAYPEDDGTHAQPYRFWFVNGLGVKFGLAQEEDGLWYLDHVEYFDPEWKPENLSAFKYGGALVDVDTIGPAERR